MSLHKMQAPITNAYFSLKLEVEQIFRIYTVVLRKKSFKKSLSWIGFYSEHREIYYDSFTLYMNDSSFESL